MKQSKRAKYMQFSIHVVKMLIELELEGFDESVFDVNWPLGDDSTAIRLKELEIQEKKWENEK